MEKLGTAHLEPVPPSSDNLNQPSLEIVPADILSADTQWLIIEMEAIANGTQGDAKTRTMVGLAAPQVGVNKRIIVVDVTSTGRGEVPDLRVYVNPVITPLSPATELNREGCFSAGNVCGVVERASQVLVEAYDRNGNPIHETYSGFTARIFQHETDHLDGIRFPERISDDSRLHWVEPNQYGEYREQWPDWPVKCSREAWEAIKSRVDTS